VVILLMAGAVIEFMELDDIILSDGIWLVLGIMLGAGFPICGVSSARTIKGTTKASRANEGMQSLMIFFMRFTGFYFVLFGLETNPFREAWATNRQWPAMVPSGRGGS